jgi:hypothetical protein
LFEILVTANPNTLFLVRISELSKQIRKQLWDILHSAASINITWIDTLAGNLNNIKLNDKKINRCYTYNIYDNPCWLKAKTCWILCNILDQYGDTKSFKVCVYSIINNCIKSRIGVEMNTDTIQWHLVTSALTIKLKHLEYLNNVSKITNYC